MVILGGKDVLTSFQQLSISLATSEEAGVIRISLGFWICDKCVGPWRRGLHDLIPEIPVLRLDISGDRIGFKHQGEFSKKLCGTEF